MNSLSSASTSSTLAATSSLFEGSRVTLDRNISDFSELSDLEKADMRRLYGGKYEGEGWFGRDRAEEIINAFFEEFPQTTR